MRNAISSLCDQLLQSAPPRALSTLKRTILFDTNIVLDRWVFNDPSVVFFDELLNTGAWQSIGHRETLKELVDVISRAQFNLSTEKQSAIIKNWIEETVIVNGDLPTRRYCKDQDDDKFFALATLASPCLLLSKDKKVLKVKTKAAKLGITVLSIDEFRKKYGH
ncbi:MAG TPA: PIN domain-containing protein [Candidatus Aphodousia faecipullorum]|nr:PIN domain-containing protein [Candidatus Aphodousia faecipullorum]